MTSQFDEMMLPSDSFDIALILLSSLATGPSFTSMSILVLNDYKGLTRNREYTRLSFAQYLEIEAS